MVTDQPGPAIPGAVLSEHFCYNQTVNKIDEAWQVLKRLPPEMQEAWAQMILDHLDQQERWTLTDEQVEEVRRRRSEKNPTTFSAQEAERRIAKLLK